MVEVEEVSNKMQVQMRLHPAAAAEEEDADLPLPALFDKASHLHSLASSSSLDQEGIRKGVDLLRRCDEMVSKVGLFSSNETKDDISTANLKYLLVPYYLGEMTERVAQEDRIPVLKASQDHLKEFISICEALELISEDELEISRQKNLIPWQIEEHRRLHGSSAKRLQKQSSRIKERKERRRRHESSCLSAPIELGGDLLRMMEKEREGMVSYYLIGSIEGFDLLDMLKKEEEIVPAVKEGKRRMVMHLLVKCLMNVQKGLKHGTIMLPTVHHTPNQLIQSLVQLTSERERMAAQVFQPSYRLPTMSIEEAGLREMKMMEKWQERTAKMIQESNSAWHKDGSRSAQEDEDAEEEKARGWDDWKDDNPRGAGNKKLTPCG
uniref:Chilling-inducible protein n=1 Tax=Oryza sativa TaxID=4530 RepID=Q40666_ORYSA|nr:chilling-inducible protein [Oryza sativa Japonica Group]